MRREERAAPAHCETWTATIAGEDWRFCEPDPIHTLTIAAAGMGLPDLKSTGDRLVTSMEIFAASFGVCCLSATFEAQPPETPAGVNAYARAVMRELWAAGLKPSDWSAPGVRCMKALQRTFATPAEIDAQRDFSVGSGVST